MSSVIYKEKKLFGAEEQELKTYIDSDEFKYARGIVKSLLQAFVDEKHATVIDNDDYAIKSKNNDNVISFFFEFDKNTKELVGVFLTVNKQEVEFIDKLELHTLSTNEDVIFPICSELGIG